MRKVVDTNFLQDEGLRDYLSASPKNIAVVIDYAELEIVKTGKDNLLKSTEILVQFPKQVVLAKTADVASVMRGKRKGMKKRFSDGRRTTVFRKWGRHGREKLKKGEKAEVDRVVAASKEAVRHLELIKEGTKHFAVDLEEAAKQFTPEELRMLRNKERFTEQMTGKMLDRILHFAKGFFEATGWRELPAWEELAHTYIFRLAVCACMHALHWMAAGGAKKAGEDRIQNDIVDATFAAYATCFDGFLTKDKMALEIYKNAQFVLQQVLALKPPKKKAVSPVRE
jgi:hypothetical protein